MIVFLLNGVGLPGQVASFDRFVIRLKGDENSVVYKHAIASIVPMREIEVRVGGLSSHEG